MLFICCVAVAVGIAVAVSLHAVTTADIVCCYVDNVGVWVCY